MEEEAAATPRVDTDWHWYRLLLQKFVSVMNPLIHYLVQKRQPFLSQDTKAINKDIIARANLTQMFFPGVLNGRAGNTLTHKPWASSLPLESFVLGEVGCFQFHGLIKGIGCKYLRRLSRLKGAIFTLKWGSVKQSAEPLKEQEGHNRVFPN